MFKYTYRSELQGIPSTHNLHAIREHNNIEVTPTATQLPPLPHNHPLSLVPRNFRNLAITHNPNFRPNISQSPIQHIMTHHSQDENTSEQIIEQPHTTAFQSQNNNFFSPR